MRDLVLAGTERDLTIEESVPEDRKNDLRVAMETTLWGRGVVNPVAEGTAPYSAASAVTTVIAVPCTEYCSILRHATVVFLSLAM